MVSVVETVVWYEGASETGGWMLISVWVHDWVGLCAMRLYSRGERRGVGVYFPA